MALNIYSKFYYDFVIDEGIYIDFQEGVGPVKTATLRAASYTITDLAIEAARALNEASSLTWTVSVDRYLRQLTFVPSSAASFLGATGPNSTQSALPSLGLGIADFIGFLSLTGAAIGKSYSPQLPLQDYVPTWQNLKRYQASVTKSASGNRVSVQSFGLEKFMKCSIKYVNNLPQPSGFYMRYDAAAVENLTDFLTYVTSKGPIEFMENEDDSNTFEKMILESTVSSSEGVGFELKEYFDKSLPGHYDSGLLIFKVIA